MSKNLNSRVTQRRRGAATIWVLAALPVLLVGMLFVMELGHLWAARAELENSLEAASRAAVKTWRNSGLPVVANWTTLARARGVQIAAANTIDGDAVVIATSLGAFDGGTNPNENSLYAPTLAGPAGNLVFGAVTEVADVVTFDAQTAPTPGVTLYGVRAQAVVDVPSLFGTYFGAAWANHSVTVDVTAVIGPLTPEPRLVRVDNYLHP